MAQIDVTTTERELSIRINGLPHFRLDRRQIVGMQSYIHNLGRDVPKYVIVFFCKDGAPIVLDYEKMETWSEILTKMDTVAFLEQWKEL